MSAFLREGRKSTRVGPPTTDCRKRFSIFCGFTPPVPDVQGSADVTVRAVRTDEACLRLPAHFSAERFFFRVESSHFRPTLRLGSR